MIGGTGSRARTLVIENTDDVRAAVVKTFEMRGVPAVGASSCCEAEKLMRHECFRAAVVDLGMPVVDGLSCAGKLKLADPGLHLFAFTAYSEAAKPDTLLRDAGFDRCFRKGGDEEQLFAAVRGLYEQVDS